MSPDKNSQSINCNFCLFVTINLFINSDAILIVMHCDLSRVKILFIGRYRWRNTPYRKNIAMNVFLVITEICQPIFKAFYAISLHLWRNEFLNDKFHSDLFVFLGSSLCY